MQRSHQDPIPDKPKSLQNSVGMGQSAAGTGTKLHRNDGSRTYTDTTAARMPDLLWA